MMEDVVVVVVVVVGWKWKHTFFGWKVFEALVLPDLFLLGFRVFIPGKSEPHFYF